MLPRLSLSLQFALGADAAQHRAVLPRHAVTRWIRHGARLWAGIERLKGGSALGFDAKARPRWPLTET